MSEDGVSTDPAKIDKVTNWPTPTSQRQLQQFLGLASYYRRFVKDFATLCRPLHRLMEKGSPFTWTDECQQAFNQLRTKLTSPPILAFPNFSKPFILNTNASDSGIGAVLSQRQENGEERVIAYASRTLSRAERNYSVTRRELLAVITFVLHFRQYLLGTTFELRTDHNSLKWLKTFKHPEGQLARWLQKLEEFSFTVQHRPGRKHGNADSLSRLEDILPVNATQLSDESLCGLTTAEMHDLQLKDETISPVLLAMEAGQHPDNSTLGQYSFHTRKLFQLWDQLVVEDGVLLCCFVTTTGVEPPAKQMVAPKCVREDILESLHAGPSGGHLVQAKTLSKLKSRFYWPGHYKDTEHWCRTCPTCATRKTPVPHHRAPLQSVGVGSPMQLVAVDLLGPFPLVQLGTATFW